MGCIKYHLVQISKDGDRADAQWPLRTCSGPEVLNQPLLPSSKNLPKNLLQWYLKTSNAFNFISWLWFALAARAVLASYIRI
jgi:hypothetical protein